jgi:hypothetical protein
MDALINSEEACTVTNKSKGKRTSEKTVMQTKGYYLFSCPHFQKIFQKKRHKRKRNESQLRELFSFYSILFFIFNYVC